MGNKQDVFGMPVIGWPPTDSTPLEVVGIVKFFDAVGAVQYWSFRSVSLHEVEAHGMTRMLQLELDSDTQANMYDDYVGEADDD